MFLLKKIYKIFVRKNIIYTLIFIELGFASINILLALTYYMFHDIKSQILIIYIFTLTAIETALGLALFILYFKMFKTLSAKNFYTIK